MEVFIAGIIFVGPVRHLAIGIPNFIPGFKLEPYFKMLENEVREKRKKKDSSCEGQTVLLDYRQGVDEVSLSRLKLNSDIKHTDGPPSKTSTPTLCY